MSDRFDHTDLPKLPYDLSSHCDKLPDKWRRRWHWCDGAAGLPPTSGGCKRPKSGKLPIRRLIHMLEENLEIALVCAREKFRMAYQYEGQRRLFMLVMAGRCAAQSAAQSSDQLATGALVKICFPGVSPKWHQQLVQSANRFTAVRTCAVR